ncbi:indolethylamine N-methyltransferase-like [Hyperolius riggenbachi]|uniref:indolethylamine N-methyltransferase-like n=1 Tax=Hyperolius riggenbachi TaxID=752182 RepID=UPI0035A3B628
MESESKTMYHQHDEFPSKEYLELFFSNKPDMAFADDSWKFPMANLHYIFSSGFSKGKILMDVTAGPIIHHLLSACNVFKEIILLKVNAKCNMETNKWLNSDAECFDWTHTLKHATKLEGKSDQIEDKITQVKSAISQVIPCDFEKENITDPAVLPLADCILSLGVMDTINKNEDDYMRNMEKLSKMLKPGGHLILVGALNTSYIIIGGERFHVFCYDESFVKKALNKLGFVIDYCAVQRRKNDSEIIDYKALMFVTACKTK